MLIKRKLGYDLQRSTRRLNKEKEKIMRDIKRIDRILKLIEKAWKKNPDSRLGQLLINTASSRFEDGVYYYEDDALEDDFTEWIEGR